MQTLKNAEIAVKLWKYIVQKCCRIKKNVEKCCIIQKIMKNSKTYREIQKWINSPKISQNDENVENSGIVKKCCMFEFGLPPQVSVWFTVLYKSYYESFICVCPKTETAIF